MRQPVMANAFEKPLSNIVRSRMPSMAAKLVCFKPPYVSSA